MARIRRDPKYIGSAIINDLEVGDEVCLCLEDGTYRNREVSIVEEKPSQYDDGTRVEVTLGDVSHSSHVIIGAEAYDGEGLNCEWTLYAYEITDDPDSPQKNLADPTALYIVDQDLELPDKTYNEVKDELDDTVVDPNEVIGDMEMIIGAAQAVRNAVRKVEEGILTLAEFEQRLDTLATKHGGRLPFK